MPNDTSPLRVLVCVDHGDLSASILAVVRDLATRCRAEVEVLHVADSREAHRVRYRPSAEITSPAGDPVGIGDFSGGIIPGGFERLEQWTHEADRSIHESHEDAVRRYLADASEAVHAAARQVPGADAVLEDAPDPAEAIIDYARTHPVDLIAMATHSRRGVSAALLGSVTDAVVRSGVRPVLVVHPREG